jgi:hypothetical protein
MADPGIMRGLRGTGALRCDPGNSPASTSREICIVDSCVSSAVSAVVYILLGSISWCFNIINIVNTKGDGRQLKFSNWRGSDHLP